MGLNRKQVAICLGDDVFARALCIILDRYECSVIEHPTSIEDGTDVLVYKVGDELRLDALAAVAADIPTIVIGDEEHLFPAVDAHCRGFLLPSAPLEEVSEAVDTVAAGGAVVPPQLLGRLLRYVVERRRRAHPPAGLEELTEREMEVYRLAAQGARKEDIGRALFISPATARTHLQNVYRKLGVHSQAELIALASRSGELDREEER